MNLIYNWDTFPCVRVFLKTIYINTFNYLQDNGYSIEYANEFVNDIEDYLYYFKLCEYNINSIINRIKEIEVIEFYDSLFVGKNDVDNDIPYVINRGSKILLSTDIKGDNRLSSSERRRLYLYQGLLHSILSFKSHKSLSFSRIYSRYLKDNKILTESIVNNGWLLLEDTLSQEIAEKVTYFAIDKIRPSYRVGLENEKYLISDEKIYSNLENYRFSQKLLIRFGFVLDKIGNIYCYSKKNIINDLIKCAINNEFSSVVINEYDRKQLSFELYQLLYLMGLLLNEKYREYNMHFIHNIILNKDDINKIYDNIITLTDRLINMDDKYFDNVELSNVIVLYDEKISNKIRKLIKEYEI